MYYDGHSPTSHVEEEPAAIALYNIIMSVPKDQLCWTSDTGTGRASVSICLAPPEQLHVTVVCAGARSQDLVITRYQNNSVVYQILLLCSIQCHTIRFYSFKTEL